MNPLWTSAAVVKATAGACAGTWVASGVSIDSRSVKAGDLFVALKGPNFDGHAFALAALKHGASAALIHEPVKDSGEYHNRLVVVKNTFAALQSLAVAARTRANARIVAVTGSVGKTGTKEALRLGLSFLGKTHANEGNLNNHWGVPLSLSRMPADAAFGVFELGMNHPGEIAPLSRMVRPHVAVITTVEAAHLEFFNSIVEIADEKAAIMDGLEPGGTVVLPRDNAQYPRLVAAAKSAGCKNTIGFGASGDAVARLLSWSLTPDGTQVAAEFDGERITYDMIVSGRHWALNSVAALAAVRAMGCDFHRAAGALSRLDAPPGRGARSLVQLAGGTLLVIDESYNASPAAVRVLAETLAQMHQPVGGTGGGRLIVVLGDMLELGSAAAALHAGLGPSLKAAEIDIVFTAGALMEHLHKALPAPMRGGHAKDSMSLIPLVIAAVRAGDVVAVKGSHSSHLESVVAALLALDATRGAGAVMSPPRDGL
ncbi:MAG: UDP-N-acetylmuramoyl-tripeptide--D-alanyl-D-alanine ligase [Rhodospirillaceae bacterium]|nr:UDP-N-acetylmuramoyl-tripeptide--D-alanyl-D-alanine ligase [Rhodospirillaceae bacterium]